MTKVLIIENSLYVTGGLNAILSAIERLRADFEFHFIIPQMSAVAEVISRKGHKVSKLPFLEISKSIKTLAYPLRLYQNARKVLRYMQAEEIKVLHVNDVFNLIGCLAKKLNPGIYLVNHVRLLSTSYIAPLYPFFSRQVRKYADAIICVSGAVQQNIKHPANSLVIYDVPQITENLGPWAGLLNPETPRILYLGNFIQGKGQNHGLAAFIPFQKSYPGSHLTFAGDAPDASSEAYKKTLKEQTAAAGITANVSFKNKVTDVEREMKSHDVILNMSESESFSFVCLEAVLYGVPLVVANSGGPAEITDEGRLAELIPNRNADAAAKGLAYIAQYPEEIKHRAEKAKSWARAKFDPIKAAQQLQAVYEKV